MKFWQAFTIQILFLRDSHLGPVYMIDSEPFFTYGRLRSLGKMHIYALRQMFIIITSMNHFPALTCSNVPSASAATPPVSFLSTVFPCPLSSSPHISKFQSIAPINHWNLAGSRGVGGGGVR